MGDGPEVVLVRHGQTGWSAAHRHTGRTDVPLDDAGRHQAESVGDRLAGRSFALVLASPLSRALDTARLAGLGAEAVVDPDLVEWDYGGYEGLRTVDIRRERPGWDLWRDGVPGGETLADVCARAERVLARARAADGGVAVFAHAHLLRVLTARWLGLAPADGRLFALDAGTVSILGHERETPVIRVWNDAARPAAERVG